MNWKAFFLSALRHSATIGGSFVAAKGLVSGELVESAISAVVAVAGFVWSMVDKREAATAELWQSVVRQLTSVAGGALIGAGVLEAGTWEQISTFIATGAVALWGPLSKLDRK